MTGLDCGTCGVGQLAAEFPVALVEPRVQPVLHAQAVVPERLVEHLGQEVHRVGLITTDQQDF